MLQEFLRSLPLLTLFATTSFCVDMNGKIIHGRCAIFLWMANFQRQVYFNSCLPRDIHESRL